MSVRDYSDDLPVFHDRKMPDLMFRHDLDRHPDVFGRAKRYRVGGHDAGNCRFTERNIFRKAMHDVSFGEDAGQPVLGIENKYGSHIMAVHDSYRIGDKAGCPASDHLRGV